MLGRYLQKLQKMCLCGLYLLSNLQNKSDLVTHIPEEDPALGQSLFVVHEIWIKVLKVVIKPRRSMSIRTYLSISPVLVSSW